MYLPQQQMPYQMLELIRMSLGWGRLRAIEVQGVTDFVVELGGFEIGSWVVNSLVFNTVKVYVRRVNVR